MKWDIARAAQRLRPLTENGFTKDPAAEHYTFGSIRISIILLLL